MGSWPDYILDKYVEGFEQYLSTSLSDASSDCRRYARQAYLRFKGLYINEAESIFERLDPTIQKAIVEEEQCGGKIRIGFGDRCVSSGTNLDNNRTGTHSALRKKAMMKPSTGYLSPGLRRTEISRKSKNRLQAKTTSNKFLSEERELTEVSKRAISKDKAFSSGFSNLQTSKIDTKDDQK